MPRPRLSWRPVMRVGLAATIATAGLLPAPPASAATVTGPYVHLGDSYAAGSGVPNMSAGLCLRSDKNYGRVVAAAVKPTVYRDVTCGGAKTNHMTEPHTYPIVGKVNDPQFNALSADTKLVTLTIGGNNLGQSELGIGEVILRCVALAAVNPAGAPCKDSYAPWWGSDSLAARIDNSGPQVDALLRGIKSRAPKAKVLLVGYPSVLPENHWDCLFKQPITVFDARYLLGVLKRLNGMLAARAAATGVTYVDTYTPSLGHDICSNDRWLAGILPDVPDGLAPVHPNTEGERAMARAVLKALG